MNIAAVWNDNTLQEFTVRYFIQFTSLFVTCTVYPFLGIWWMHVIYHEFKRV